MAEVPEPLPAKVVSQITKAGLPEGGNEPFRPMLVKNRWGEDIIQKRSVLQGPKRGKRGWVDEMGRIWVRDSAHAHMPDHRDVQIGEGEDYIRVGFDGSLIQ